MSVRCFDCATIDALDRLPARCHLLYFKLVCCAKDGIAAVPACDRRALADLAAVGLIALSDRNRQAKIIHFIRHMTDAQRKRSGVKLTARGRPKKSGFSDPENVHSAAPKNPDFSASPIDRVLLRETPLYTQIPTQRDSESPLDKPSPLYTFRDFSKKPRTGRNGKAASPPPDAAELPLGGGSSRWCLFKPTPNDLEAFINGVGVTIVNDWSQPENWFRVFASAQEFIFTHLPRKSWAHLGHDQLIRKCAAIARNRAVKEREKHIAKARADIAANGGYWTDEHERRYGEDGQ